MKIKSAPKTLTLKQVNDKIDRLFARVLKLENDCKLYAQCILKISGK